MNFTPQLFILGLISSCSLFQEKPVDRTAEYITRPQIDSVHHFDIRKTMTRTKVMAGGDYEVKAYPFTQSLISAMANDLSFERGLTETDKSKLYNQLKELYLANKSCFHIDTSVLRFEQASKLKDWKIKVIDHKEQEHDLLWVKVHPKIKTIQRRSADKLIRWLNEATACTTYPVSYQSPFSLRLTASYAPFPFSAVGLLHWEYEASDRKNKKPVDIKESRTKKRYRGW